MYYIKIHSDSDSGTANNPDTLMSESNTVSDPDIQNNEDDNNNNELVTRDVLQYYCRHCGYIETNLTKENVIVSISNITQKNIKPKFVINEYTKYDPTIPRIHHIPCVSKECPSIVKPEENPQNVLYIRYDNDNLKYMFMCEYCNTTWSNDNNVSET